MSDKKTVFTLWFDEIGKDDVGVVGGKNANLGMYQNLTQAESEIFKGERINVPYGFANRLRLPLFVEKPAQREN